MPFSNTKMNYIPAMATSAANLRDWESMSDLYDFLPSRYSSYQTFDKNAQKADYWQSVILVGGLRKGNRLSLTIASPEAGSSRPPLLKPQIYGHFDITATRKDCVYEKKCNGALTRSGISPKRNYIRGNRDVEP